MRRRDSWFAVFAGIWTVVLCKLWTPGLGEMTSWASVAGSNDVPFILQGYKMVPNPLLGGWKWWCGPWIEETIQVLRPIASYLLWFDCWIGERFGPWALYSVGFTLYSLIALECCWLAWRLTRSRWCALLAGTLAAQTPIWNFGGQQPASWLVWLPVHHDLLFIGLLLGALICFDTWIETSKRKWLWATWIVFLVGCLTKEYGYIFPVLAAVLGWIRADGPERRKIALRQAANMFVTVVALFAYRHAVLPKPYNPPPFKYVHFLRRPYFYWFYPFYRHVLTEIYWVPGLAFLLFLLGGGWIKWARSETGRLLAGKPFGAFIPGVAVLAVLGAYLQFTTGSTLDSLWYFADSTTWKPRMSDLFGMLGLFYVVYLVFKYRSSQPGIAALLLMMLIYLPVWSYLGWHYCLAGWFIRSGVWWPVVARLVYGDIEDYLKRIWVSLGSPGAQAVG